jgi:hypothetical protein
VTNAHAHDLAALHEQHGAHAVSLVLLYATALLMPILQVRMSWSAAKPAMLSHSYHKLLEAELWGAYGNESCSGT